MSAAIRGPRRRLTLETNVKAIELRELWRRYKGSGSDRAREPLVVAYSPLVKYVAGRMSSGLPAHVEESDLISRSELAPRQGERRRPCPRAAGGRLLTAGQVRRRPDVLRAARARRGVRPHL